MESQQFDAGREGARRLHRVLSLYCALFCWKNKIDAVLMAKSDLYNILGVSRIKEARRVWLEEDVKDYFEYYLTLDYRGEEHFVFSRQGIDELKISKSYKKLNNDLDVMNQLEFSAGLGSDSELEALKIIKDKFKFLQGTTSATSHLLGIQMSSLASGVISINDIFKSKI